MAVSFPILTHTKPNSPTFYLCPIRTLPSSTSSDACQDTPGNPAAAIGWPTQSPRHFTGQWEPHVVDPRRTSAVRTKILLICWIKNYPFCTVKFQLHGTEKTSSDLVVLVVEVFNGLETLRLDNTSLLKHFMLLAKLVLHLSYNSNVYYQKGQRHLYYQWNFASW